MTQLRPSIELTTNVQAPMRIVRDQLVEHSEFETCADHP